MEQNEKIEKFSKELDLITSEDIRTFAKYLIANADDYFFTVSASSSAKYHPESSLGEEGLVRHTKSVFYFVNELSIPAIMFNDITVREKDMLLLCALVHDIKKQGDGECFGQTMMKEHPLTAARYIRRIHDEKKSNFHSVTYEEVEFMMDVVLRHMGPWSDNVPETVAQKLLFYADYIASRREVNLDIFGQDFTGQRAEQIANMDKPVMTVDGYKFTFGKHRDKTLQEVYDIAPDYLLWIVDKTDFFNSEVQDLVKQFLELKKEKV